MSGFSAAFNSPLTISGNAKIYSIYTSQELFNGQVYAKFSTDGKFLVAGLLNFADDNISISGKLYADLSNVTSGDVTILFLADIPDQVELLSIYGKLKMGFRNSAGEEVEFAVHDPSVGTASGGPPTASLIGPVEGGSVVDSTVVNSDSNSFDDPRTTDTEDKFRFVDIQFSASGSASIDLNSLLDPSHVPTSDEITLNPNPIPIDTVIDSGTGIARSGALIANEKERTVSRSFKAIGDIPALTEQVISSSDLEDGKEYTEKELLALAMRKTGTRTLRYLFASSADKFDKGEVTLTFAEGSFKHADVSLQNGNVVVGASNEKIKITFEVQGATASLIDPGEDAEIDLKWNKQSKLHRCLFRFS